MPKLIGDSLATHRERVRERVFTALREQLYERGFEAVTLSGVAAAAGVGRSAMYNHFPDRQALLVAFVEDEAARYVADLDAALAGASSSTKATRSACRSGKWLYIADRPTPAAAATPDSVTASKPRS